MNKESTEQAAREFCYQRRAEWKGSVDCTERFMADFARQQVAERERQIADELDGINDPYDAGMHISIALQQFIKQLRGEGE